MSAPFPLKAKRNGSGPPGPDRILGESLLAQLIRSHDWSSHELGPIADWPDVLVCSLNGVLRCAVPRLLFWGAQCLQFYNDAAIPLMAERHSRDLGVPARDSWSEAWPTIGPQLGAVLAEAKPTYQENVLVPVVRDGILQDVFWTYSYGPIYAPGGEVVAVDVISQDTTRELLARQERDDIARQLHQVQEAATDSVVSIDRNWCITYMNATARRATGPLSNSVGKHFWETFPAAVYKGSPFLLHYYAAMDRGLAAEFEGFYPDPLNIWVHVQVRPTSEGIVLFFRDITEERAAADTLRQTTDALQASEEELRWTLQLSAPIQWTASPQGGITSFSDRWLELTGLTRTQAMGDGWAQIVHDEDRAGMAAAWMHSIATGEPYDIEHRVRTAAKGILWMRSRAFSRRDEHGVIVKWYGTTEDIDARKKAEEALRTTEKLAVAGRLAASIAHEINNPLESVTNLLYLARTSRELAEIQGYLNTAERELRRVSVITNQTLRFHKQSTARKAVTCGELFEAALSIYGGRLANSGVEVEKRKRAQTPIECFEGEIRQVLSNLVDNAIDAMHPTGGRLLIRSRETHDWRDGRKGLALTVADTGPGMSPEVRKRLFDVFYTTKGDSGTGLGLWISKEIVDRHQGALRVRSSQSPRHSGTVFTLFLPF